VDTLFIRGENSDYITEEDERQIRTVFPNSEIQTIEDSGHWIHADKPDEMFHAVMKFVL
jgi:pimeloyl-ACP methyl ester carboxylesterase